MELNTIFHTHWFQCLLLAGVVIPCRSTVYLMPASHSTWATALHSCEISWSYKAWCLWCNSWDADCLNGVFNTFEIGKGNCTNAPTFDSRNEPNCFLNDWNPKSGIVNAFKYFPSSISRVTMCQLFPSTQSKWVLTSVVCVRKWSCNLLCVTMYMSINYIFTLNILRIVVNYIDTYTIVVFIFWNTFAWSCVYFLWACKAM